MHVAMLIEASVHVRCAFRSLSQSRLYPLGPCSLVGGDQSVCCVHGKSYRCWYVRVQMCICFSGRGVHGPVGIPDRVDTRVEA